MSSAEIYSMLSDIISVMNILMVDSFIKFWSDHCQLRSGFYSEFIIGTHAYISVWDLIEMLSYWL